MPLTVNALALKNGTTNFIKSPAGIASLTGGAAIAGLGAGSVAGYMVGKRRKKRKKSSSKKGRRRTYATTRRRRSKRSKRHKSHFRKSSRKIHYTKRGQPYVIGAHGKARFIKRSSAHNRKRRKGGYY